MRKKNSVLRCMCLLTLTTTSLFVFQWKPQEQSSVTVDENRRLCELELIHKELEIVPTSFVSDGTLNRQITVTHNFVSDSKKELKTFATVEIENKKETVSKEEVKEESKYDFTDEEIKMLYRITEAEATDQDIEAKQNVCSVIINRIESDEFPDTVEKVIFQKKQFSPVYDKRYYSVEITDETKQAVNEIVKDGVINDALFFCNMNDVKSLSTQKWFQNLTYLFKDSSGHSFYK